MIAYIAHCSKHLHVSDQEGSVLIINIRMIIIPVLHKSVLACDGKEGGIREKIRNNFIAVRALGKGKQEFEILSG